MEAALVALGEALAEVDRSAQISVLRFDARKQMIRQRLTTVDGRVLPGRVDTTYDHLPAEVRATIDRGGEFADLGERSAQYARLLGLHDGHHDDGLVALRGILSDGVLSALVALYEPKRFFGTRVMERFGPYVALFDLAFARFSEREARDEAVRTLEDVTQRVHGEYLSRLATLEQQLQQARDTPVAGSPVIPPGQLVALEGEVARAREEARRATRRADAVEEQVTAAVGQLEAAHVELHRRSESIRQKTRTLYLIERVLGLDAATSGARQLVDGLLALVGDDMQAQRCSLMLRAPEHEFLYIAAAKGLSPEIADGTRVRIGHGVAGKVAETREPLLVTDVEMAGTHPLLKDQYFTTGSFISFPLVYHDELVGVVNLTNRAQRGVFVEEDVERVRLLALVISLIASAAELSTRLLETISVN